MPSSQSHAQRVQATVAAFESSMSRFLARIESAPADRAEYSPEDGGWSVAGIAWHVAVTNEQFARLVDGSAPLATPPADDFVETPFAEIAALVPDQLEAPDKFHPPAGVTKAEALARARASQVRLAEVLRSIPESRGFWSVKSILGQITLYQVGEWATAHVARHNAQAKRRLI
jgi:hypothetical protein